MNLSLLSKYDHLIGGLSGGLVSTAVCHPMDLLKIRYSGRNPLCLQYESNCSKRYAGMIDCLSKIAKEEGLKGLYRGFIPGLIGTSHGALQFMVYNKMKDIKYTARGLAKESQLDHNVVNRGVWHTMNVTLTNEGIYGLYKGCLMANLRQLPAAVVTFLTYENVRHYIKKLS
uniref:Mitochondrial carrier protein n=1 Tax=Heterorhabditis bacteriophora TaxID=37862 RepID=A0A1I7WU36_HETBA